MKAPYATIRVILVGRQTLLPGMRLHRLAPYRLSRRDSTEHSEVLITGDPGGLGSTRPRRPFLAQMRRPFKTGDESAANILTIGKGLANYRCVYMGYPRLLATRGGAFKRNEHGRRTKAAEPTFQCA
jgi:hypothetical protein